MKHIFYVHSHTTYLTAVGTITLLNLNAGDVIFITARKYQIPADAYAPAKVMDWTVLFEQAMSSKFRFWKLNQLLLTADADIAAQIGQKYIAYVPHSGVFTVQVLITNKNCEGFHFIEEGSNCYSRNLQIKHFNARNFTKEFYSAIFYKSRYWETDFAFSKISKRNIKTETFGISKNSFSYLPVKHNVVTWPQLAYNVDLTFTNPFFIFEGAVEMDYLGYDTYLSAINEAVKAKGKPVNYVKFHPAQTAENKQAILNVFEQHGFKYVELPGNIPFEALITSNKGLDIVGFGSSLLIYAKLTNHHVSCFENLLMADPKYKNYKSRFDYDIESIN